MVLPLSDASGELEIFAGQDKNGIVNRQVWFNDPEIINPDPLDPEKEYTFSWDFDDRLDMDLDGTRNNDGESLEKYTKWEYDRPGIYIVTLTVSDGTVEVQDTLQVTVREDQPPYLEVEAYQVAPYGIPYQLDVTAYDDALDDLIWQWDLGDSQASGNPSPLVHTYQRLGELDVTVWVFDLAGNEASARFVVDVVDVTNPHCNAGPDLTIMVNGTAEFDGTGSSDDVGVTTWSWSFMYGDLAVMLTGPTPNQTFYRTGTYVVGLQVQDAAGNVASDTMAVTVLSPGDGDGDKEDPKAFVPSWESNVWDSLMPVVIIIIAFAVSSTVNSLRERRTESTADEVVFYRHHASH